jgi:hypothetical protein
MEPAQRHAATDSQQFIGLAAAATRMKCSRVRSIENVGKNDDPHIASKEMNRRRSCNIGDRCPDHARRCDCHTILGLNLQTDNLGFTASTPVPV